jgi:hypothetical protein
MRQCKLITLVILISVKSVCGQKRAAYDVVNAVYKDFLVVYCDKKIDHYLLLSKSYNFPSNSSGFGIQENQINAMTGFVSMEEILKMLSDSSFVGTVWKQRLLERAKVINAKQFSEISTEEWHKKNEQKKNSI